MRKLGLVKRLYFDQLPFFKSYQEMVKRAMLFENNANYRLGYKTGWGFNEKDHAIGWIVGWIEENNHPYFFVLNIESPDKNFDMITVRMKMLKDILSSWVFLKGRCNSPLMFFHQLWFNYCCKDANMLFIKLSD